jgi:hypothetical protein
MPDTGMLIAFSANGLCQHLVALQRLVLLILLLFTLRSKLQQ